MNLGEQKRDDRAMARPGSKADATPSDPSSSPASSSPWALPPSSASSPPPPAPHSAPLSPPPAPPPAPPPPSFSDKVQRGASGSILKGKTSCAVIGGYQEARINGDVGMCGPSIWTAGWRCFYGSIFNNEMFFTGWGGILVNGVFVSVFLGLSWKQLC